MASNLDENDRFTAGMEVRRKVLGDAHVDRSIKRAEEDPFLAPVQQMAVEFGWHHVWCRDGLERKTRSLLCIAMLAALGRGDELRVHVRGAVNNGCSKEEIREALLQVGAYAGLPAALEGFREAKEVLDDMGI